LTNSEYEKIIKEGTRVEWYGESVPETLITPKVKFWCDGLLGEIHMLEGELSDLKGVSLEKRKNYLKSLWYGVKNAPYALNGDVYLKKKERIEKELKEKEEKPTKKRKTSRKKTTPKAKTTSEGRKTTTKKGSTKNSGIIFGKK
jgi:hypothetical protein